MIGIAENVRDRLARLLPDLRVDKFPDGRITINSSSPNTAAALADRLERADADRAKVERVEALIEAQGDYVMCYALRRAHGEHRERAT